MGAYFLFALSDYIFNISAVSDSLQPVSEFYLSGEQQGWIIIRTFCMMQYFGKVWQTHGKYG